MSVEFTRAQAYIFTTLLALALVISFISAHFYFARDLESTAEYSSSGDSMAHRGYQTYDQPVSAEQLASLAKDIHYFDPWSFAYNRPEGYDVDEKSQLSSRLAQEVIEKNRWSTSSLLVLLKNNNPRIRTLAAAAIFAHEDANDLPALASCLNDNSNSFPYSRHLQGSEKLDGSEPQTVGKIIEMFLCEYGYFKDRSDFETYWRLRKNRKYCSGWFNLRLMRAARHISCPRANKGCVCGRNLDVVARSISGLKNDIDSLPLLDRTVSYLALHRTYREAIIDNNRLLSLLRQLDRSALVMISMNFDPTDDPDFRGFSDEVSSLARSVILQDSFEQLISWPKLR